MMRKMASLRKTTSVWWDINSCPIPEGFNPCLVGRRIETALKKSGYSDPVTITAVGNLREGEGPGEDVLRKLSSSGIALTHNNETSSLLIESTWGDWMDQPGATVMLISGSPLKWLGPSILLRAADGFRILLAYHERDPFLYRWRMYLRKDWLWESLLSGSADDKHKTTTLVLQDKYTESVKYSPWYCRVCDFAGQSFEDFITHLKSEEHGFTEWDLWSSGKAVDRRIPDNIVWGRSKEWDLLNIDEISYHDCPDVYLAVKREWDLWASRKNVDRTIPENFVWGRSKEWNLVSREDMASRDCLPYKPRL